MQQRVMNVNNMRGRYKGLGGGGLGNYDSDGNFIGSFPDYVTLSTGLTNTYDQLEQNASTLETQFQSTLDTQHLAQPGSFGNYFQSIPMWAWLGIAAIVVGLPMLTGGRRR